MNNNYHIESAIERAEVYRENARRGGINRPIETEVVALVTELSTLRAENERRAKALEQIAIACEAEVVNKDWVASHAREALAPRGQEGEG